jgi:outer membrane protein assembly factor BamB
LAGAAAVTASPGAEVRAEAQALSFTSVWSEDLADGSPVVFSSPDVATLAGAPAVVVGDQGGHVYAFSLAGGAPVPGWPATTGGVPVESTPSAAALTPGSPDDTIFVGAGTAAKPHEGGYEAFGPDGTSKWSVSVHNPGAAYVSGVVASLAVGDLQGAVDVVAPSVGQDQDAINAITGTVLAGFPWFQGGPDFATPALGDLYGTGKLEIVNGGAQAPGLAYKTLYTQGGHVRVLSRTGNEGYTEPNGGLKCEYKPDESVESSPAVGPFLAGGKEGIAVGTGNTWPGATRADSVLALTSHCRLVWAQRLDGLTTASPALADLMGNGALDVVEGTNDQHGGGWVYALNGATGSIMWRQGALGEVIGGVVTADLGAGHQDVVVASTRGAEVLDGGTGAVLAILESHVALQNCALVTDDPNGSIGVTLAGYGPTGGGVVEHYELAGSSGAKVAEAGAWPMFHHDPYLTGNAEERSPGG